MEKCEEIQKTIDSSSVVGIVYFDIWKLWRNTKHHRHISSYSRSNSSSSRYSIFWYMKIVNKLQNIIDTVLHIVVVVAVAGIVYFDIWNKNQQ